MNSIDRSRRQVVQGLAAGSALALAGGVPAARASGSIAATTYPGAWETAHRQNLVPAFQTATKASVNLVASLAVDTVSRVVAAKNNPPFDVVILDEGPFLNALQHDIFEKIPTDKVPNLKDIPPRFLEPRGLGVFASAQVFGIAYNTDKIKTPPKSWNDLLKPEFKGRVGLVGLGSTLGSAWMIELAKLRGGNEENLEPGFDFLKAVLPNVGAVAANPGALATLFQQGQIDISVHYNNNVGDLQARGVPIALARPDTGWSLVLAAFSIIKNTKSPELAAAYINAAISPEVQSKMAEAPFFVAPTNGKATLSKGVLQYGTLADMEKFNRVDWAKLNPRRAAMIDRFNREIKV
ncbi:MAG: ABC transporter substrate-binding protein [Burkholderiaceae bacterium]|jgi:putative spermidine/putrescine transport system substrate-binding protein|nr:ABC transporter substrate-binding protein [Burkholderiaceae bacterium]